MIVLFGPVGAKLQWDDIYPSRFRMRNRPGGGRARDV